MARLQISQKTSVTADNYPETQGGLALRLLIPTLAWLGLWLVLSLPNAPVSLAAGEQSNPLCGSTGSVSSLFRATKPGQTYGLACTIPLPISQTNPPSPGPLAMAGPGGSPVQTSLKLSNSGLRGSALDVTLDSVTPGFNILGLPVTKLAPGATASLGIACQPAFSPATGKLVLATTDPAQPLLTYQLSCSSAIPAFTAAPGPGNVLALSSIDGSVEANTIAANEILVSNEGQPQSQLNLTLNSLSPGFSVQGLPTSVSAGNVAVSLQVTCQPLAALTGFSVSAGVRKGTLVLNTSDPSQPTVSYTLSCSAVAQPVVTNNASNTSTNFNAPAAISTLVAAASIITAPPALAQNSTSPDNLATVSNAVAASNAATSSEQTLPQATTSVPTTEQPASPLLGSQALGLSGASAGIVASLGNGSAAGQSGTVAGQLGHWANAQSAAANALAGLFAAS